MNTDTFTNATLGLAHSTTSRLATQVSEVCDVPPEFRSALGVATDAHGPLEVAFCLPAMVRPSKSRTVVIPQRMACVFREHLALLSSTADTDPAGMRVVRRSRLLGYELRGFLLDCWITVYHAGTPLEVEIQFPVQSGDLFAVFVNALFHTNHHDLGKRQDSAAHSVVPVNCPAQFSRFLHAHPELGEMHDCFLQTPVPFGKARRQKCALLLIARTEDGFIALTDEDPPNSSWLGLRLTYVLLRSVIRAEWQDQFHLQQGALFLDVGSTERSLRLEWSLAMRFREAALEWIEELNSALRKRASKVQSSSM